MNKLYTPEIKTFVFSREWPKNLIFDIVEYAEPDLYLQFVFYRDNLNSFDGDDKLQLAKKINEVMTKLRKDGVPCYLQVKAGTGL